MIIAHYDENGEIETSGEVCEGDVYNGFCCIGFDWEVRLIFPDPTPDLNEIWGRCQNENCQNYSKEQGESDPYRGVSTISQEDFEEWLANKSRKTSAF